MSWRLCQRQSLQRTTSGWPPPLPSSAAKATDLMRLSHVLFHQFKAQAECLGYRLHV